MPLGLIQPALTCGSSWLNLQSSMNPQSAKSANSQKLRASEHKYLKLWHTAEDFMLLMDFLMGSTFNQMKHVKSQSCNDGTLSLGQSNPCYEKLSQCSSGGQLDVLVSADRGAETAERTQDFQWLSTPQTKARLPAHSWHDMLLVWICLNKFDIPLHHAHVQRYEVSQ